MPIIYTLIARGANVLVDFTNPQHDGNFSIIAQKILAKIPQQPPTPATGTTPASAENKLTYIFDGHTFNFQYARSLIFMCMADEAYGRAKPFAFLAEIIDTYFLMFSGEEKTLSEGATLRSFRSALHTKIKAYSVTAPTDAATMAASSLSSAEFRSAPSSSTALRSSRGNEDDGIPEKAKAIRRELDDVKDVIMDNLDRMIARGDQIDNLVDKTDHLSMSANTFKRSSKRLNDNLCYQNFKMKLIIVGSCAFVFYLFLASICGFTFSSC